MQRERAELIDHGVTRIVPSLVAHHSRGISSQVVYHSALAFIAPVCATHHRNAHLSHPLSAYASATISPEIRRYLDKRLF